MGMKIPELQNVVFQGAKSDRMKLSCTLEKQVL
jgi:hypothetical protein